MEDNIQKIIAITLDKLLDYIEKLPFPEKGKGYLQHVVLIDFIDRWQVDDITKESHLLIEKNETGQSTLRPINLTYGITNLDQLKRYVEQFLRHVKELRLKGLEELSNKLKTQDPDENFKYISEQLYQLKREEFFAKSGNTPIKKDEEWSTIVKEFLSNEKEYYQAVRESKRVKKPNLLSSLLKVSTRLQGLTKSLNSDEDSRNSIIAALLTAEGFIAKDQSKWGKSETGQKPGEIDIKVEDLDGKVISICECFILFNCNKKVINSHLIKLFDYDANGLNQNFIIIYSQSKNFLNLWERYCLSIPQINFRYRLLKFKDVTTEFSEYSDIRIGIAKHERNDKIIEVYHIFVNMNL